MTARILVVDDDVALAEMISIVLRGEGYVPIQAFDGKEALDLFPDAKPDLVLSRRHAPRPRWHSGVQRYTRNEWGAGHYVDGEGRHHRCRPRAGKWRR